MFTILILCFYKSFLNITVFSTVPPLKHVYAMMDGLARHVMKKQTNLGR